MEKNKIKKLRVKLGVTQEKLAQLLGVSFSTVNRWETGKGKPSPLAEEKIKSIEDKEKVNE